MQAREHVGLESQDRLVIEDQQRDEQRREYREPPAPEEAGENDRQIVEAEKRDLVVHHVIDREQRRDQQHDERALEIAEKELLRPLHYAGVRHDETLEDREFVSAGAPALKKGRPPPLPRYLGPPGRHFST